MIRYLSVIVACMATSLVAQQHTSTSRVLAGDSAITDTARGAALILTMSDAVPHRIFTLDAPMRLVVDFEGLSWNALDIGILDQSDKVTDLRFGTVQPGWSRLVVDLATPLAVDTAGMTVGDTAVLSVTLTDTSPTDFAENAGAPVGGVWAQIAEDTPSLPAPTPDGGPVTVVIDPGHGGIDPGTIHGGVQEADLMLQLGVELAAALNATGDIRALLTREADVFVSLERRMSIARAARADLLISLHADALAEDDARGASVYTLSDEGAAQSAARMAARHERGDLLAGLDLTGRGDRVATALMDLARVETGPRSDRIADATIAALRDTGARLHPRPRRQGQLAVLNAPDFAAILLEAGFLSNETDRAVLSTVAGRARLVQGVTQAVQLWAMEEAARTLRLRQ